MDNITERYYYFIVIISDKQKNRQKRSRSHAKSSDPENLRFQISVGRFFLYTIVTWLNVCVRAGIDLQGHAFTSIGRRDCLFLCWSEARTQKTYSDTRVFISSAFIQLSAIQTKFNSSFKKISDYLFTECINSQIPYTPL